MTLQRQKELLIGVFVTLYSALFFLGFQLVVNRISSWSPFLVVVISIGALVWCALMACATSFVVNRSGSSVIVAALPALLLLFLGFLRLDSLIGASVVFLVLMGVQRKISWELNTRVNVHVIPVYYSAVRYVVFALLISLITLSIPSLLTSFDNNSIAVPADTFKLIIRPFESVIAGYLPGYTTDSTIDEIITRQLKSQYPDLSAPEINLAKPAVRQEFAKQFGTQLSGRETLADISAGWINKRLRQMAGDNRQVAVVFVIGVTFVAVRIIVPIIIWPVLFLVSIILRLSEQIGLITILRTQVTVERMSL